MIFTTFLWPKKNICAPSFLYDGWGGGGLGGSIEQQQRKSGDLKKFDRFHLFFYYLRIDIYPFCAYWGRGWGDGVMGQQFFLKIRNNREINYSGDGT